jgi:hypothetical protein
VAFIAACHSMAPVDGSRDVAASFVSGRTEPAARSVGEVPVDIRDPLGSPPEAVAAEPFKTSEFAQQGPRQTIIRCEETKSKSFTSSTKVQVVKLKQIDTVKPN